MGVTALTVKVTIVAIDIIIEKQRPITFMFFFLIIFVMLCFN